MAKQRINSIDALRIIAAFFIVCIHMQFFAMDSVNAVARFAVPVFFMISGYFFTIGSRQSKLKSIKKVLVLTVASNILYFVYRLALALLSHNVSGFLASSFSPESVLNFFVFNESPFGGHLWFLSALLYTMIIAFFLSRFKLNRVLVIIVIAALLICDLIFGRYSVALMGAEFPVIYVRNFIFVGIPYFFIGGMFCSVQPGNLRCGNALLIALTVLFTAGSLFEKNILEILNIASSREHYLSTTFLAITVFALALKNPASDSTGFWAFLANLGRRYSLAIYIIHPIFRDVIGGITGRLGTTVENAYFCVAPVVVFFASLVFAVIYYKIKGLVCGSLARREYKH